MIQLVIRPTAEADVEEAVGWYEGRELGLGTRFLDELREAFTRISLMPRQFPTVGKNLRRALLRRFPYAVYFILRDESRAAVIAVLHQHRNPVEWKKRLRAEP